MFCYTGGSASTAARCSSSVQIIREAWLSIMHCLSLQPEVRNAQHAAAWRAGLASLRFALYLFLAWQSPRRGL